MTASLAVIATRDCEKYSETFVRRHIAHLFGGNTAVIAFEPPAQPPRDKPLHLAAFPEWLDPKKAKRPEFDERAARHAAVADARETIRFLKRSGATHLLCEFGYVAADLCEVIARSPVPVFCYFRGNDATRRLNDPVYVETLKRVMPHLAGIVAVSRFLVDRLAGAGITHPNVAIIPSGTDTRRITPSTSQGSGIVTIGRLIAKKDPLTALAAFERVAASHPDARWTVVGDGLMAEELRAQIAARGLTDRVEMRGVLPHDAVIELLRGASVCLQAFREAPNGDCEGQPSVLQEAMAAGTPILTTRHSGIPEIVTHERTGLLCDEGDVAGLAAGLDRLLSDAALRDRLAATARDYAEHHLDYRVLYPRLEDFLLRAPKIPAWRRWLRR